MTTMRVKLRSGNHEIEVDGSKSEVDQTLELWWTRLTRHEQPDEEKKDPPVGERETKLPTRHKSSSSSTNGDEDNNFDPVLIANAIKEDGRHKIYQEHVLHKPNMLNKIVLVCRYADEPLTSGEITKTLRALDVKADTGNISNSLKKNSGKFLASAARKKGAVPRYKLSSRASSDFEAWIANSDK
jgi:hypothetical protein